MPSPAPPPSRSYSAQPLTRAPALANTLAPRSRSPPPPRSPAHLLHVLILPKCVIPSAQVKAKQQQREAAKRLEEEAKAKAERAKQIEANRKALEQKKLDREKKKAETAKAREQAHEQRIAAEQSGLFPSPAP